MRVAFVCLIKAFKSVLLIKRDGVYVGIYGHESATGLVIAGKIPSHKVNEERTQVQIFVLGANSQTAQLYCRVTFQSFGLRKPLFLAKTVEFSFIPKIAQCDFVVCYTDKC